MLTNSTKDLAADVLDIAELVAVRFSINKLARNGLDRIFPDNSLKMRFAKYTLADTIAIAGLSAFQNRGDVSSKKNTRQLIDALDECADKVTSTKN